MSLRIPFEPFTAAYTSAKGTPMQTGTTLSTSRPRKTSTLLRVPQHFHHVPRPDSHHHDGNAYAGKPDLAHEPPPGKRQFFFARLPRPVEGRPIGEVQNLEVITDRFRFDTVT